MKEVSVSSFWWVHYSCLLLALLWFLACHVCPSWRTEPSEAGSQNKSFLLSLPWYRYLGTKMRKIITIGYYNVRQCVILQSLCVKKWVQCLVFSKHCSSCYLFWVIHISYLMVSLANAVHSFPLWTSDIHTHPPQLWAMTLHWWLALPYWLALIIDMELEDLIRNRGPGHLETHQNPA